MITIVTAAASEALVSTAAVKAELSLAGSAEDAAIDDLIARASAALAAWCRREGFGRETVDEVFRAPFAALSCAAGAPECLILSRDLAAEIGAVTVDGTALGADEYKLDGGLLWRLSDDARAPWSARKVTVRYDHGYALPDGAPQPLRDACLALVVGAYRRRGEDPAIRSEADPNLGTISYFDPRGGAGLPLDEARLAGLGRFRRWSVG